MVLEVAGVFLYYLLLTFCGLEGGYVLVSCVGREDWVLGGGTSGVGGGCCKTRSKA